MKSFDFPQIFNPILGSSKFLKIQNGPTSLKKCTSEAHTMGYSTLKFVNLQLFKQSSKNMRFPTEVDREKSLEPFYNIHREKNQLSESRKMIYEVQRKKRTNKDQKFPELQKRKKKKQRSRGRQKGEKLERKQFIPSNHLMKNSKKDSKKNKLRISKIIQKCDDQLSQSIIMIDDHDIKEEDFVKSKKDLKSKKVLIKEEFDPSRNKSRLETNKSLLSTRKQNNKKKKEKLSFFTGELAEDLIKQIIIRKSKSKRTLTLQVINLRKGSIGKSSDEKYYSKQDIKNESEVSLQFQEERRKKTSKNLASTRKRVAFLEEDEELKNMRKNRKKRMIKRKQKQITSIEHLIHDDQESEELINYRLNSHKNKKVTLRKQNIKIQDNIYAELNYFNMRLIDKPKELFDEEHTMQLPINIQNTSHNNNMEEEKLRREKFKRESQMIDFAVRMSKGYILKQLGIR